jgi:hypothetical protein
MKTKWAAKNGSEIRYGIANTKFTEEGSISEQDTTYLTTRNVYHDMDKTSKKYVEVNITDEEEAKLLKLNKDIQLLTEELDNLLKSK